MWSALLRRKHSLLPCIVLFGIISIICSSIVEEISIFNVTVANAMAPNKFYPAPITCPSVAVPTGQSLLVVLLDRSGSLTQGSFPTDPNGYSTSVTKALADLWPGDMAVIPFTGDTTTLPIFGPDTLSDLTQRADLKDKVQNYPIGGDTPLEPAMQEALDLLHQKSIPPGSRVIVITDGNPTGIGSNDGPHQEDAIRKNLIPQYCQQGIPVSVFGLTIDPNTPDGQDANHLLTDIATGTGTTYNNVTGPADLAKQVISLFAQWQRLTFTVVKGQGSNFPIAIDTFARQVSIVAFLSESSYKIKLIDSQGNTVTVGVQKSTPPDRHYEIDSLVVTGPISPGIYTVYTGGDPNAQVYALVNSPLQTQLVAPTAKTVAYADKSVLIQAQFVNGIESITPGANDEAQIVAKVTLFVNGRPAGPPTNDVVLTQQGNIFSGQTLIYDQPGQLHIELDGTYQHVQRQTSVTLQLLKPLPPLATPTPTPICSFSCLAPKYGPPIIAILIALILLVLAALVTRAIILRRREQPKPYGYLTNGKLNGDVELEKFKKPVISSKELEDHGDFRFGDAKFELVFDNDGPKIRAAVGNTAKVTIDVPSQVSPVEVTTTPVEIKSGRKIYVNGNKAASFETVAGRRWSQHTTY